MRAKTFLVFAAAAWVGEPLAAQASQHALRFHGTGAAQLDRVRIAIDDDGPGPDASAPCDLGAGSFTVEFWLRGALADNASSNAGGDVQTSSFDWIYGNTIVDRDIWGGSARDWGVSIAGGYVRFGVGAGDSGGAETTIEGDVNVLDGTWRHVACVRDVATGRLAIYVDGELDFESTAGVSTADVSYPNDGVPGQVTPWGPYIVLGAEKHDAGSSFPSFAGGFDELRLWSSARTAGELQATYDRVIAAGTPGLVGYYRFEEGAGTVVADSSAAASPVGELIAGVAGNGEWASYAAHPANSAPVAVGSLPAGFTRNVVATGFVEPTSLAALPDGRIFIGERGGRVLAFANGQLQAQPVIQIPVDTSDGESGLVSLAVDPQFALNGWLYAFFTSPEPRDVVQRFTVVGATANPASALSVWTSSALAPDFHHGGALEFGADGKLYVATGDQRTPSNAQSLANDFGKLLRLNTDGSAPLDNPFAATPGASPNVFALGLRNPFRMTFDSVTGGLWIGDVGANLTSSHEELNRVSAGANFGWPNQEGPACFVSSCASYTFPAVSYRHDDSQVYWNQPQGSITAGVVYRASAFPPQFQGNLFFGDYANRWIRRAVLDSASDVQAVLPFLDSPEAGTVVDLAVGADGALYFVTIGVAWTGAADAAALHRIEYTGSGNQPPIVVANATPTQANTPPLVVQFASSGTNDPDNGPSALAYSWDFGDGASSTLRSPQHAYTSFGEHFARLSVSDGAATTISDPIAITVGARPVASISTPAPGHVYRAGDVITFAGSASDLEDGALPASALSWQVLLVHNAHAHPFVGPLTGVAQGQFTVPLTGHSPVNTHYEIRLTATDSHGIAHTDSIALAPDLVTVSFTSSVAGVPLFIDGEATPTPHTVQTLIGHRHWVEAQPSYSFGAATVDFVGWSDGRPISHYYTVRPAGGHLAALYAPRNQSTVTLAVPAANRNAEHWSNGQQPANEYDGFAICMGRDTDVLQGGFQFAAPIPQGATIVSARVDFTATIDQQGSVALEVRGYDASSAPPFVFGSPTPLTQHAPLTSASASWSPAEPFAGQTLATPDLSAIVQEIVSRADWQEGGFIGLVFDGASTSSDAWRCIRNVASGQPPTLVVTFEQDDYSGY